MAIGKEATNLAQLHLEVAAADLEAKPHLFEITCLGRSLTTLLIFHFLILVFTPVNDFSDRWLSVR